MSVDKIKCKEPQNFDFNQIYVCTIRICEHEHVKHKEKV